MNTLSCCRFAAAIATTGRTCLPMARTLGDLGASTVASIA